MSIIINPNHFNYSMDSKNEQLALDLSPADIADAISVKDIMKIIKKIQN